MIVETRLGAVRGKENKSVTSGEKYYSFLGIPYAKPPIGELRFSVRKFSIINLGYTL